MIIGVPNEFDQGQTLVAATPDTTTKLIKLGYDVWVQMGAGIAAHYLDEDYKAAGASIVDDTRVWQADIVICLDAPRADQIAQMKPGALLISRLNPGAHPEFIELCEKQGITALALDMVPRISRAQSMDVRSSMANVSGYRAVIEAASHFGRLLGGQVTAAGKINPAKLYVIGVGVAGLAAIGTAKSMGAQVYATDVRSDVADQVQSLNAEFVPIPVTQESEDGYAKEMTAEQAALANKVYAEQAAQSDIIITTAQVPGKKPPLLLDAQAVAHMKPGSVIVDMGASPEGGNVELTQYDEVLVTDNGVTIIGLTNMPKRLPGQASQLYGQNIVNFLKLTTPEKNGQIELNEDDEVVRGVTVTLDGAIMWPPPPIKVSAAPKSASKAASKAASKVADNAQNTQKSDSTQADPVRIEGIDRKGKSTGEFVEPAMTTDGLGKKPAWKRWWWKILLGVLAVALVMAAPEELTGHFVFFELACVVGFYVITNVTHALHTPLMSVTNAISGIIIAGALTQVSSDNPVIFIIAAVAILLASINIFGGFLVTHRMLDMFKRSSEE